MRLNEAAIKKTEPPKAGNRVHYDDEIAGLGLRVTAAGARSFILNYRHEGRERRLTIGKWPAWTATAAREEAKKLRVKLDQGIDPLATKEERRKAPTVRDIAEQYMEIDGPRKKWGATEKQYLERDVLPVWGRLKAEDIKRRDVIALVERKAQQTPTAANRLLGVVRSMFNWAIRRDLLEVNPCLQVKPPAQENRRDRVLTEDEIRALWEKLDTAAMAPACRAALRLILATAQRPGEVIGAERSEFDIGARWWTIPAPRSKNRNAHRVPLNGLALELIGGLENRGRFLFPSPYKPDSPITVAGLSNAVSVNQAHFGIARWTPHDLRRTAASHMASAGVSRFIVGRVLNHADRSTTAIYERYSYDLEKRKALDAWARKLQQIITGKPAGKVVPIG